MESQSSFETDVKAFVGSKLTLSSDTAGDMHKCIKKLLEPEAFPLNPDDSHPSPQVSLVIPTIPDKFYAVSDPKDPGKVYCVEESRIDKKLLNYLNDETKWVVQDKPAKGKSLSDSMPGFHVYRIYFL